MRPDAQTQSDRKALSRRRKLTPSVHVLLLLATGVAGIFDHLTHGWGAPVAASAISLSYLILYWENCWSRPSFWFAIALASMAEVPLVNFARPQIEQNRPYMLLLMLVDGFFAAVVVSLISQIDPKSPLNSRNYSSQP
jgi:hypothetical protein